MNQEPTRASEQPTSREGLAALAAVVLDALLVAFLISRIV